MKVNAPVSNAGSRGHTLPALPEPASGPDKWIALWAATAGYMLDAMDVLLYVFALQSIRAEFSLTNAEAGYVSGLMLIAAAFGGIFGGWLADRFGRKRLLMWTIMVYSAGSLGSAFSTGLSSLLFWRSVVGVGLGGEWSAGAILVAETWPAHQRAKAMGVMQSGWALGYMLAAVVSGFVLPRWGWRVLFLTGLAPVLLTFIIRRCVREPAVWTSAPKAPVLTILRPPLRRITINATALATATLLAYWGLFTWLPGFLAAPLSAGGAGLDLVRTSAWMFAVQLGALAGYLSFGALADKFGRRPVFVAYVLCAAALTPLFALLPSWGLGHYLIWLAPALGFAGSGYFSLFGAMLAELYPTSVRGIGQGFTYNFGRLLCAGAPVFVGALADRHGVGAAIAVNSGFYLMAAVLIYGLPETRNTPLQA